MLFISALPVYGTVVKKGSLAYCFLCSSYSLFDSSEVTTGHPLRSRWCEEAYSNTEHWLCHCPAIGYGQELIMARLTDQEICLDDRETTIAILNSQNVVAYRTYTKVSSSWDKFVNITN